MTPETLSALSKNITGFGLALILGYFFYRFLMGQMKKLEEENAALKDANLKLAEELRAGSDTVAKMWGWFKEKDEREQRVQIFQEGRDSARDRAASARDGRDLARDRRDAQVYDRLKSEEDEP